MPTGAQIIAEARKHLGANYVYGSDGPRTFDCSGLVTYTFKQFGISLPHHAADQAKLGKAVDKNSIQPGDLVFSNWGDGPNSHVGIATSSGQIIVAPHTGAQVRYDNLSAGYLAHVTAVRRINGVTNVNAGAGAAGTGLTPNGVANGSSASAGAGTSSAGGTSTAGGTGTGGGTGSDSGVFQSIADAIRQAFLPLTSLDTFTDQVMRAFMPSGIIRLVCGIAGAFFIAWGTVLLAREVK